MALTYFFLLFFLVFWNLYDVFLFVALIVESSSIILDIELDSTKLDDISSVELIILLK